MATMIRITRGYENLGEFSEEEVRRALREGRFLSTDHGWSEGMAAAQPLSEWSQFAVEFPPTPSSPAPDLTPPISGTPPVQTTAALQTEPGRRIEIFAPFGVAYEVMKRVLFRPFDLVRWLIIGFAAFISGAWGGGFGSNPIGKSITSQARAMTGHGNRTVEQMPVWLWPFIVGAGIGLMLLGLVLWWITSRGKFVFTDCIVRNRAAIAEPWREYRREGNSYFLFMVALGFAALIVIGGIATGVLLPMGVFTRAQTGPGHNLSVPMIFALVFFGLVCLAASVYVKLVAEFMVPVMYRRRCNATEAFRDVGALVLHRPAPFFLLALFGIVLLAALGIIGTIVACMTCCIGALPYVSTVLLLPAFVWLRAFLLCFIRQFGADYDVWANAAPAAPPPLPA